MNNCIEFLFEIQLMIVILIAYFYDTTKEKLRYVEHKLKDLVLSNEQSTSIHCVRIELDLDNQDDVMFDLLHMYAHVYMS